MLNNIDKEIMDLKTRSLRAGMNCEIDVFYERKAGFSEYINDRTTYKVLILDTGSFVVKEGDKFRTIVAPAAIALNEKAEFKVVSESEVRTRTLYFKPTIIRDEFTIDAINEGKYDRFINKVSADKSKAFNDRLYDLIVSDTEFAEEFSDSLVYQDALLLCPFLRDDKDLSFYSLTMQEYHALRRLAISIDYEIHEQPDNLWILRTKYFITSILFMAVADFYRNNRQDDLYDDPLVAKVTRFCWEHLNDRITLEDILKEFNVNKNKLNEAFNKELSLTCMTYLEQLRVNLARKELQYSDSTISEIGMLCGYSDTNYFTKVFKKYTGMTPSEYQKNLDKMC